MLLPLIQNGRSNYVITIRRPATEPERFAAEELSRYLHEIAGAKLPIETESRRALAIVLRPDLNTKSADAFRIRTKGSKLVLHGASPRALLFAVYTFLEDCLGCGWIKPGDEHVPDLDTIKIGKLDVFQSPSFSHRILIHFPYRRARALKQIDWLAKQKMNVSFLATNNDLALWDSNQTRERVIPELRKRGVELRGVGHAFTAWLPPARYSRKHPEYYSLIDGKRDPDISLCVSNPAVAREVARNIGRFVDANPEIKVITLWHNDLAGWCQCDGCQAMNNAQETSKSYLNTLNFGRDPRLPRQGPSNTSAELTFVNRVAEWLEQTHPAVQLETLAYGANYRPSSRVKPRRDVLVGFAAFDKCIAPELALFPMNHRTANQPACDYLRAWRKQTGNFYIYEYFGLFHDFTPLWDVMRTDLQWYRKLGIEGISTEIASWNELHMYTFAKLAWNCHRSTDAILRSYCARAYGPVAELMFQHWDRLRKARLNWNWNCGQVRAALKNVSLEQWFESRRRNPKWRTVEAECRTLAQQASFQLQKSPLNSKSLAVRSDSRALERVRKVVARWNEVPTPWWFSG